MSRPSQESHPVSPAAAAEPGTAGASPAETLSIAFNDTLGLLFTPFNVRLWIKLSIVCLLLGGGTPSAAFHWSLGSLPGDIGFQEALEQVRRYFAQHFWLILLASALGLALGLILLYLRAIFRFVLVDAIIKQEVLLEKAWAEIRPWGQSYFLWLLGALLAVGTALAAAVVVASPYFRVTGAAGGQSYASAIALAGLLMSMVLLSLVFALVVTLTDDLVVPIMWAEHLPVLPAWRKLWKNLRQEARPFAVYVLLRFAVSVAVGVAVLFILLPVLMGLFSGAIIAGALVVLALRMVGVAWIWNPLTIVLASVCLLLLMGLLLILLSVAGMPGQVLLQNFGIRFIASREPSLRALQRLSTPPRRKT